MATYPIEVGPASGPAAAASSVVYISMVAAASPSYDRYPTKLSIRLGSIQALLGGRIILFNIVALVFLDGSTFPGSGKVGHGIWCGVLFIITGAIGVSAGKKKKKFEIVAYMVMCIISASLTFFLVLYGILGALAYHPWIPYVCSDYRDAKTCTRVTVVVAMESCMAIIGFIEAALFIWGSILCCKIGLCCCSRSYQPMALHPEYVQLTESKHHADPPPDYEEEED